MIPYRNYIYEYHAKITSGEIIAGKWIKQIYKIIVDGLERHEYFFNAKAANMAIKFIESCCHHSKGRNDLLKLELWQKAIVSVIFGVQDEEKIRIFREIFIVIGRKNGKSLFASAIIAYMAFLEPEYGQEIYCLAPKLDQAALVYDGFHKMVLAEPDLEEQANYFMDTTKFIKRLATYVAVEHTAFIVPIEDKIGRLCGWYPLRAERCEVVEVKGQVYLRYLFANGEHGAIEFEKVGIITDFEYTDDLFGEDNRTLKPTMQLIHTQNEGIINAVKNSANIRFLAKVANMLKPEDIKKERQRFTEDNLSADNDSGMIIYDNKFSELKQVESKPYTPNALQMQNIQENVCTHFGTNMDILQNKFDEETWNAYYEGKIEPFAIQLSLVMSNMTFSDREIACGNAITFSANRLQYASNATKLQVSTQLFDRALLNRNGVMDIWNMPHVEGGEKYYIRKEYTEVSELNNSDKEPKIIIQQVPQAGQQGTDDGKGKEPTEGEPKEPPDDGKQKEGVNNAD